MYYKLIILSIFILSNISYSQEIEPNSEKLETLDWDIMFCGRAKMEENKPCILYVKNKSIYPIQVYRLNKFGTLSKIELGNIEPQKTKKINTKTNEYWVLGGLDDNALGIFQTTSGVNEIVIDDSNFKKSVKLPKTIEDRSLPGTSSGGAILRAQESYDVLHYNLRLEILPESQYIKGENTITAKVMEELNDFVFDLDSFLTIENVYLIKNDRKIILPVKTIDGKHWCKLPTPNKKGELIIVDIEYSGNPRIATHAPYKGGFSWSKTLDCKPWIATSCQIDGADLWFPCKDYQWDEPDSVDLSFIVPNGLKAISNGILVDSLQNKNGTTTFNWKVINPINNYGIALNIAPYKYVHDDYTSVTGEELNLGYWVLPENLEKARAFYPYSKKYLHFLETHLGPYPFRNEKLGIVEVPFIAMEHQTIIAMSPNYKVQYPEYNKTLFHEICHEWLGNLVTSKDWSSFWIHESFVGYMELLYEESNFGEDAYKSRVKRFRKFIKNKIPLAPEGAPNSRDVYNGDSYSKGTFLLHSLRHLIGKDSLLLVIKHMAHPGNMEGDKTDKTKCRFTTTEEFFDILEKVSQQDFAWFKEVYFKNASLPELSVLENEEGVLLRWITKENGNFPMPLEIKTKNEILKVSFKNGQAQLNLKMDDILEIDPNNKVLFSKYE